MMIDALQYLLQHPWARLFQMRRPLWFISAAAAALIVLSVVGIAVVRPTISYVGLPGAPTNVVAQLFLSMLLAIEAVLAFKPTLLAVGMILVAIVIRCGDKTTKDRDLLMPAT